MHPEPRLMSCDCYFYRSRHLLYLLALQQGHERDVMTRWAFEDYIDSQIQVSHDIYMIQLSRGFAYLL